MCPEDDLRGETPLWERGLQAPILVFHIEEYNIFQNKPNGKISS